MEFVVMQEKEIGVQVRTLNKEIKKKKKKRKKWTKEEKEMNKRKHIKQERIED